MGSGRLTFVSRPPVTPREPFLTRVRLKNYKSIAECDVALGRFTLLVGRNGSGKSNFLDALAFTADALDTSFDQALRVRGGFEAVRYAGADGAEPVTIEVEASLPGRTASYRYEIGPRDDGGVGVRRETARIDEAGSPVAELEVDERGVRWIKIPSKTPGEKPADPRMRATAELRRKKYGRTGLNLPHPPMPDGGGRLFLGWASLWPEFRALFDTLRSSRVYRFDPAAMRRPQTAGHDAALAADGANLAGVWAGIEAARPSTKERIVRYLAAVVPEIADVRHRRYGPWETVGVVQRTSRDGRDGGGNDERFFDAAAFSDGTLRTLGVLVAAFQPAFSADGVPLVGIEEPEAALHPAAAAALFDALQEAATGRQILTTTHSPELADRVDLSRERLLVVEQIGGRSLVGDADEVGLGAIRDGLATPGELLREDQLRPVSAVAESFAAGA